jgi:hypothetical protein
MATKRQAMVTEIATRLNLRPILKRTRMKIFSDYFVRDGKWLDFSTSLTTCRG